MELWPSFRRAAEASGLLLKSELSLVGVGLMLSAVVEGRARLCRLSEGKDGSGGDSRLPSRQLRRGS